MLLLYYFELFITILTLANLNDPLVSSLITKHCQKGVRGVMGGSKNPYFWKKNEFLKAFLC